MVKKVGDYVRGNSKVCNLYFHLVFVTKYRHKIFVDENLRSEMEKILLDVAAEIEVDVVHLGVMPEHIHLLISFSPTKNISGVVKRLKGASARYFLQNHTELREEKLRSGHLWAKGYYIGTLGNMTQSTIKKYIDHQCD